MKWSSILQSICLIVCCFFCQIPAFGQDSSTTSNIQVEADSAGDVSAPPSIEKKTAPKTGKSSPVGWFSSLELWLSLSVLCFGLITLAIEITVIKAGTFKPDDSIKLLAVTLIVISTLFIITAGFDSEQIAPAMGLFGTVAGYMLGKATPAKET